MGDQNTHQSQDSVQTWNFIRLDQFRLPPELARERVRRDFLGIWDRLVRGRSRDKSPPLEIDLMDMPGNLLAESAPAPDWREGVPVLDEVLQEWWQERSGRIQILVGAPYSGTAEIVAHWAAVRQCPVLPDPPFDQIKSGGGKWLEQIDRSPDRFWVIPHLERVYLRHNRGLAMFRALLDKITTSSTRFLLACDSWAWAYLSKALHLNALFPIPLVLEAFNREKLGNWFSSLAARTQGKHFIFRQADIGNPVLTTGTVSEDMKKEGKETSDFLVRLAAFSRGIPGVA